MAEFETKGKQKVDVHYVNAGASCVVEENFEGYYHDHGDIFLAEELLNQESVYQSLQRNTQNDVAKASPSTDSRPHLGRGQSSGSTGTKNSSKSVDVESQLALDEAYARSLQELENQLAATSFSETTTTEAVIPSNLADSQSTSMGTSVLAARQDDINPDNMTYEQLQLLGEAIGTQSRGLSDELISFLTSSTYKTGIFSRRDKHEECVICCMPYKNREVLITLPCQHHYHSSCVTRWLKINKTCPICNVEVFGS